MPPYSSPLSDTSEEKAAVSKATYAIDSTDLEKPSQTEQLSMWINRVRSKKIERRKNPKRDLRVDAVLSFALSKAEMELRNKQISRIKKWQIFKRRLLEDPNVQYGHLFGEDNYSKTYCKQYDPWADPNLSDELSSLDSFMAQLKDIKDPLKR